MLSILIVARMNPDASSAVAQRVGELDATGVPYELGMRRRELFTYKDGLHFHLQQFDSAAGMPAFERAWQHPLFVQLRDDVKPYFEHYDEPNFRSISDAMATRFYGWEAP